MTLLSVVKDVCAVVGVLAPASVFSNIAGNRTMQEMLALANEMAQRIAYDRRDWTRFKQTVTYTGDGVVTAFDLPANYKRMLLTTNVWRSTSIQYPMSFVPDTDEWLNRRLGGNTLSASAFGEWTLLGGQIHIYPVLETGQSAYFTYLDKNCIRLAGGGTGDVFMQDGDAFLLDDRLLKLGMIWQWKSQKGSPYNEDLGTYQDALEMVSGHDSPAPIIVGRYPMAQRTGTWGGPWPL